MSTGQFMEGPVSPVSPAAAGDGATEGKKLEMLKNYFKRYKIKSPLKAVAVFSIFIRGGLLILNILVQSMI